MFNILGILLAVIISSLTRGQGVLVGWESAVAATVATLVVLLYHNSVASHVIERWQMLRLRIAAADAEGMSTYADQARMERELLARRAPVLRIGTDALILSLYLAICYLFGWPDYVRIHWGVPDLLNLLPDLLPYFAMLAASWVGQWRLDRAVRGTDLRPLRYTGFHVRANLMTIAPLLLIYSAYWALVTFVPAVDDLQRSFEYLGFAVQIGLVILISLLVPVVIRLVLPGGPLPEGRLRRRLESFTRDRGLRVNQIMVWRTGSRMFATAFVIGLVSPFRYVFITDALLKRMTEDEVVAVFAHEMGHVKHRHLWWLLGFLISFALVMIGLTEGIAALAGTREYQLPAFALALAYGYFAFGYVSRRFERQADAYAAEHTSPELLAGVFLKLGYSNPAAMKKDGWRHFSLERRVRELVAARTQPHAPRVFQRELSRGLLTALAITIVGALLLIKPVRSDIISGLATYSLTQYDRAQARGADHQTLDQLRTRTLERSAAMARLDGEFERAAQWYEGIVRGLSDEEPEVFARMLAEADQAAAQARSEETRAELEEWARTLRASKASLERAKKNGTSFFEELGNEQRR